MNVSAAILDVPLKRDGLDRRDPKVEVQKISTSHPSRSSRLLRAAIDIPSPAEW